MSGIVLSTTSYGHASLCLKKYEYSQVHHLALPPHRLSPRIRLGLWIHRALQFHGQGKPWLKGLDECQDWALAHRVPAATCDEIHTKAKSLLVDYFSYWAAQGQSWDYLATEEVLTKGLRTGDTLKATLDARVLLKAGPFKGLHALVEYKTTSDIPSAGWRSIDPQTALQYALCKARNYSVDLILFDYILTEEPTVPRVRQDGRFYANTSITTDPKFRASWPAVEAAWKGTRDEMLAYLGEQGNNLVNDSRWFQRYFVIRPEAMIRESLKDVQAVLRDLHAAEDSGHYRRLFNLLHCQRFCQYAELCSSEYARGGVNQILRDAEYVIDNPDDREGR